MRRSPRRRVMPRASSSLASGQRVLAGGAEGVAELGDGEAVGLRRPAARAAAGAAASMADGAK